MEDAALTAALRQPDAYPYPVTEIGLIETHISRVFLAGGFAYKVRKPVRFDFVDFSSPQARSTDCETEVRLNRRLAPDLYLGVVPITPGTNPGAVQVEGAGTPLEYAVKMRRFDQQDLFSERITAGRIGYAEIDVLAHAIAAFHRSQPSAGANAGFGTPERIAATLAECLGGLARVADQTGLLAELAQRTHANAAALANAFRARLRNGHVRECHGDLHLGNIVLLDARPTPFDCLEFNPGLRWIDTISDLAFPFMDLLHHGRQDLAYRLLNVYLEDSGDYAGLALLPFYVALRALVRARVLLERSRQQCDGAPDQASMAAYRGLLELAWRFTARRHGGMVLMHGLSGSGKSTVAARICETAGAVRIRSDVERKRLRHGAAPADGWYAATQTERTYRRLLAICRVGCMAGFTMIADATFLARAQRDHFLAQARRLGVTMSIVDCEASVEVLRARIVERARLRQDPSEADLDVLAMQLRHQDPLSEAERALVATWPILAHGADVWRAHP